MKTYHQQKIKLAFFGTPEFSVIILDVLKSAGLMPALIVTAPDKPKGRKLVVTPPPVKIWAEQNNIPYIQNLKDLKNENFDVFVVASYGRILPQEILDMPNHGVLNVHPSLLPKLRGASPIKSAILGEFETGVTIIKLDAEMDHGPIAAQKKVISWEPNNPPYKAYLEKLLAHDGGKLLVEVLQNFENIKLKEQDHTLATFSKKIKKSDGEINLSDSPETTLRKIRALRAYFFQNGKRIIVTRAHIENGELVIDRVIPEGKKEMDFKSP